MARPGITKEQVFEAAEALAQEGTRPTVNLVRDRLGTGSHSTITPFLAEWRTTQEARQIAAIPEPPARVAQALQSVWPAAWQAAQESLKAERQALEMVKREIEQDAREKDDEIKRLDALLEQGEAETARLQEHLSASQEARAAAEQQLQELRVSHARLEERTAALGRERDALATEKERLAETVTVAQAEAEALRLDNARLEEQVKAQTQRADELRAQVAVLEGKLAELVKPPSTEARTPKARPT